MKNMRLWVKQYSRFIIILGSCMVLAYLGFQVWMFYQHRSIEQASSLYSSIERAEEKGDFVSLNAQSDRLLALYPHTIYAEYVRLIQARRALLDAQHSPASLERASVLFKQVSETNHSFALKQTALLRWARVLIEQKKYNDALGKLAQIKHYAQPWVYTLQGHAYLGLHDLKQARSAYERARSALRIDKKLMDSFLEKDLDLRLANIALLIQSQ